MGLEEESRHCLSTGITSEHRNTDLARVERRKCSSAHTGNFLCKWLDLCTTFGQLRLQHKMFKYSIINEINTANKVELAKSISSSVATHHF